MAIDVTCLLKFVPVWFLFLRTSSSQDQNYPSLLSPILTCDTAYRMLAYTSLVPRPPRFLFFGFVQYDTRKRKSAKNGEGLGTPIT